MGAEVYWYCEKLIGSVEETLNFVREREFNAGRYWPASDELKFPIDQDSPGGTAQHTSIEEAREDAAEEGTKSILDLDHTSDQREMCAVSPLSEQDLTRLFGSQSPTRSQVDAGIDDLFDEVSRGEGVYVLYDDEQAGRSVLFLGVSFD